MLRLPVHDVTSGFRAYRARLLLDIDLDTVATTGYGFQIEMTDRARHAGATIAEVPIVFHDRTAGASKMSGPIVREALLLVTQRGVRARLTGRSERDAARLSARVTPYPELHGPTSVPSA
jgi:dolichol-phosphate mannosyltransferase